MACISESFRGYSVFFRDVAFGGEWTDEERLPLVRQIIASRAYENTTRTIFASNMIIEIGNM